MRSNFWMALAAALMAGIPAMSAYGGERADGFAHRFEYTGEIFSDVHGGRRRGSVYTGLAHVTLDWTGDDWIAHSDLYGPHGTSFTQHEVGDFSVVSNIDAVHQIRLHELWLERSYHGASLRAGLLAADTEFWGSSTANLFISSAFGAPSVVSGTLPHPAIFPQGVLGVRAAITFKNQSTLRLAVLDGDGGNLSTENRHGLNISLHQGALLLAEYQPLFNRSDLQTSVRLSTYYHTGKFTDSNGKSVRGNVGFVGVVDHPFTSQLTGFARIGAALPDRSAVPWSIETGFNLTPVFNPNGKLGLAVAYVHLNHSTAVTTTATKLRHEMIVEATLDLPINKWLDVQPDVQYIVDPGGAGTLPNALVLGFRVSLHNLARTGILR